MYQGMPGRRGATLALAIGLAFVPVAVVRGASGTWSSTGSMHIPRVYQSATLLPSGKVLVAGGYFFSRKPHLHAVDQKSAELYSPATGTWTYTGSMATARHSHSATLLQNGQVLVAGGCCDSTGNDIAGAELYNPANGTWAATGSMAGPREDHIAVLLNDGRVLVAGGGNTSTSATAAAELYDPASGTWTVTGSMHVARQDFAAVLLNDGRVLVAGGEGCFTCAATATAEVYDPSTGTWSLTGTMVSPRSLHTVTLLSNGQALAAGGCVSKCATNFNNITNTAELWSPETGTWSATGSMHDARIWHTATLLGSGQVLAAGGESPARQPLASSELFDPATGTWSVSGSLNLARELHTATLLADGQVLAVGGFPPPFKFGSQATKTAELYQP